MAHSFRKLSLVVLGSVLALTSARAAERSVAVQPATARSHQTLQPKTPLAKIFLPHIQQRLATASQQKNLSTPKSMSSGVSSATPNFGGYFAAPHYPARLESSCIADPYNCGVATELATDVDLDGKTDIVVLLNDGTLNVLLNNGTGGFSTPVAYANPNYATTGIQQAHVADVNHDGYPDIVALDAGNGTIVVYPNLKNGAFGTPTASSLALTGNLTAVAFGDVNGDGSLDVVTASYSSNRLGSSVVIQTYLGSTDFTFATPTTSQTQKITLTPRIDLGPQAIALGDLNKDGKLDIAVEIFEYANSAGTAVVTTANGNGDGSFGTLNTTIPITGSFTPGIFSPFSGISLGGVQIADVNNDTNPDLIADIGGTMYTALGDGTGNLPTTAQTANVSPSDQYILADLNGDGFPDIVGSDGILNVWLGVGDGTFTHTANGASYVEDGGGIQGLVAADFDGDGKLDVAQLGSDYKQLSIFSGDGTGALHGAPEPASPLDAVPNPYQMYLATVADVEGAGNSSILYLDGITGDLVTALGNGKGSFTYVTALASATLSNLAYVEPLAADLNGDAKQDILLAGADGTLSVAYSNGDGTFQTPKSLGISTACELSYAAVGDVNGDGVADIVVPYSGDAICSATITTGSGYFVLLGTGNGAFAAPVFTSYGTELYSANLADFDKDGKLDLVLDDTPFYVTGDFGIDLLPGNGDGTFGAGRTINSYNMVSQVIVGDYNQDGKADLILLSEGEETDTNTYDTAGVLLIPGNGDGTFSTATQVGTGNFFLNGALADVNNDGVPDLLLALYSTIGQPNTYYGLSTLLGEGSGAFSAPITSLESLDSVTPMTGNFYADNATDVVVQTAYGPALFLGQGGTVATLASSSSSVSYGASETFTASVTSSISGRPTPTGTVSFYDGSTLLGTTTLNAGSAAYTSSSLANGTHTVTAIYSGDSNFNPATTSSTTVTVNALTAAFTLSSSASTLSLTRGQSGVVTLTLAANATFQDTVALSCSGAPTNATCTVNPGSITLASNGTATATVVVATTTAHSENRLPASPFERASAAVSLAGLLCIVAGRRSRKRLLLLIPVALIAFSTIAMTGCGSTSTPTAAKGSYTITVTATPSSSSAGAQSTTIALTVD